jgi:hypothetical protein
MISDNSFILDKFVSNKIINTQDCVLKPFIHNTTNR